MSIIKSFITLGPGHNILRTRCHQIMNIRGTEKMDDSHYLK